MFEFAEIARNSRKSYFPDQNTFRSLSVIQWMDFAIFFIQQQQPSSPLWLQEGFNFLWYAPVKTFY